jgi:hypothetical protein
VKDWVGSGTGCSGAIDSVLGSSSRTGSGTCGLGIDCSGTEGSGTGSGIKDCCGDDEV